MVSKPSPKGISPSWGCLQLIPIVAAPTKCSGNSSLEISNFSGPRISKHQEDFLHKLAAKRFGGTLLGYDFLILIDMSLHGVLDTVTISSTNPVLLQSKGDEESSCLSHLAFLGKRGT